MLQFSSRFACPVSGFTIEEIEPRLFSFNSPHGACERCTGLGSQMEIDPELVVPDPESNLRVQLVDTVVGISRATRENAMWKRIIEMDPSFLVNFLLKRRGANAEFQLQLMEFHLRRGMLETTIRKGEPTVMAEAILAVAISFVLGVPVAASDPDALDGELSRLINRYLMP